MTKFNCVMISRVEVEVEIPDGTNYCLTIVDKAVKKKYGDELVKMLAEKMYMEHFTKVKE